MNDAQRIPCPICNEMILPVATRCRYCKSDIGQGDGLWRDGNKLVFTKECTLPDVCLVTNQPTTSTMCRKFAWHPPWVWVLLFLGLIPMLIVASILTKKATVHVPLAPEILSSRKKGIAIAWLIFFVGVLSIVAAIGLEKGQIAIAAPVAFLIAAIVGIISSKTVTPTLIDDEYVWLKGVSTDYLHDLPEWEPR